jgi:hypothetical protein
MTRKAHSSFLLSLTLITAGVSAPHAQGGPDRIPVRVAFAPIDDGSYHVVLLVDDGHPCDIKNVSSRVALVMNQFKNPSGVFVSSMGCWDSSAIDVITVTYENPSTVNPTHSFKLALNTTHKMVWEWKTDRLFLIP